MYGQIDHSHESAVNVNLLRSVSTVILDFLMNGYFFNQLIQKRCGKFRKVFKDFLFFGELFFSVSDDAEDAVQEAFGEIARKPDNTLTQ